MTTVIVPRHTKLGEGFSRREIADSLLHPGRRTATNGYQSRASWICDLIDTKKCIHLCSFCQVKFNPKKNHYRLYYAPSRGFCDSCKQWTASGRAFITEQSYNLVRIDPVKARREQRAQAYGYSTWRAVEQSRRT